MTERFRYPPKGYAKHIPLKRLHNEENSRDDCTNQINNTTLTSSISQKIHLDRIQQENGNSRMIVVQKTRPKSGRLSGIFCYHYSFMKWYLYLLN